MEGTKRVYAGEREIGKCPPGLSEESAAIYKRIERRLLEASYEPRPEEKDESVSDLRWGLLFEILKSYKELSKAGKGKEKYMANVDKLASMILDGKDLSNT